MIEIDRISDCDTQVLWPRMDPCLGLNPRSGDACLRNVWHKLLHLVLAAQLTQRRKTFEEEKEEKEKEKEHADQRRRTVFTART